MGRNFGANFWHALSLVILLIYHSLIVQGFKIEIPNYEILKNQKILTQNFGFPHEEGSLSQMKESYRSGVMNLLNNNKGPKYTVLTFEIFMYPYRVYSYFDESNKKQYIMKRVNYFEFRQIQQVELINQGKDHHSEPQSILQSEINIQECLFRSTQASSIQEIQAGLKFQSTSQCLSERQLYSLIPDLLTIFQDDHQILEIQKVNEQFMLIKSYANLESKHQVSYFLELHLHRVNIHSFIYEARLTLMRYLLKQKTKKSQIASEISNVENQANSDSAQSQQDSIGQNQQSSEGQTTEAQSIQPNLKPLKIKVRDYFYNEQEIWQSMYEQNSAILSNLFNCETVFNIQRDTKYDYLATKATFYLAQINHSKCPKSTHDITFRLFSERDSTGEQVQTQSDMCTFLTIHKAHFIQEELPEPIEYVTEKSLFYNVEMVSLGLVETNLSKSSPRQRDLLINIQTDKSNIQITYGKAWKEIRAEDKLANLTKNEEGQLPMTKVFFLSQTKLEVQNDTITLSRQVHSATTKYDKKCSFDVKPFVITVEKINNDLFSYCAQGSHCVIMDKQCKKINEVSLMNAFGIRWQYKINYIGDKVLSYISLSRRSDLVYMTIPAPVDQTLLQLLSLPTGSFDHSLQLDQKQPGLYQINRTVINSWIEYDQTSAKYEIAPTFYQTVLPYRYRPERLFLDSTYQFFSKFKENYLDYILEGIIQEKFNQFYFPDFPKKKSQKPLKLLNIMNNTQFNRFFSDCIHDSEKGLITFKKNWKGCKVVLKTSSLMLSESAIIPPDNTTNKLNENTASQDQNKKIGDAGLEQIPQKSVQTLERQIDEIFSNSGTGKNLLIVCSAPRNSPAYSKCRVTAIEITQNFRDWNRNAKFFLEGGKYFQLYFFNMKFLTESNEDSLLQLLQSLARQQYPDKTQPNKGLQSTLPTPVSQLKSYKIHYPKPTNQSQIFISLIDYEKQQLQGILKILLIAVCILFPALTICCCVVFFKSNFQNILIYYGVINVQPSFRYPLNNLALKIKMRQLTENKYVKVHKNIKSHQVGDQLSSNSEVKYSAECCFCLEELKIEEQVAELYCKHEFHSKCFIDWVKSEPNTKCPLCKRIFTKTALTQFNSGLNSTPSPTRPVQQFSQENQSQNNFSNEIEIQFES